ncbi:MAG TPA: hypothetical protein VG407_14250 [Caulobacteraceae bacterium]|jgi:L-amino acid N-acyltransferase YncA|nr:hypothetical protein [Caulobacteraceae bacterium]
MSAPESVASAGAELKIWRAAPSLEGRRTAAVGAFACDTAKQGAQLLRDVVGRVADEGFDAVVGPMDGDTWSRHRLAVETDGRPPFLMEPHNPPRHVEAFDRAGWAVISRYASAEGPLSAPDRNTDPQGVVLRAFDPSRAISDLERIHALSLRAFSVNFLYTPLSLNRFLALYRPLLPALDPELVVLAEDEAGALQGFLFAVPDMLDFEAERAVVLKTYASLQPGLGSSMARRLYDRATARGYRRVIHALMHEDNLSARHSERLGATVFRRYALWGRRL